MLPAIKLQFSAHRKLSLPFPFPKYNHSRVLLWERSSTLDQSAIQRLSASVSAPPFLSLSFPTAATTYGHDASSLESSVGSPPSVPITQWNLDRRHIQLLNAIACITAISATWLFFSAIPALLAFKKSAESLEKLLDVTREELPHTMAAVRLSGMEISDLTMELSDLGQEITQGVRNSTRAVRLVEDRLRRLTTMAPAALVQEKATPKTEMMEPVIARTARNLREGIVNGRAMLQLFFSVSRLSRWAMSYMSARRKKL